MAKSSKEEIRARVLQARRDYMDWTTPKQSIKWLMELFCARYAPTDEEEDKDEDVGHKARISSESFFELKTIVYLLLGMDRGPGETFADVEDPSRDYDR